MKLTEDLAVQATDPLQYGKVLTLRREIGEDETSALMSLGF